MMVLVRFARTLPSDDRALFISGHRMSLETREAALSALTAVERQARGLFFSDMQSGDANSTALRRHDERKPCFRLQHILASLWNSPSISPLSLEWIADCITNGANLGYSGPRTPLLQLRNHQSASDNLPATQALLEEELQQGWLTGWFATPPFHNLRVSPLGLVPKSDGTFRLVHDFSFPAGDSINMFVEKQQSRYITFGTVLRDVTRSGRNSVMLKFDVHAAFQQVPIRAQDRHLCGVHLEGKGFAYAVRCPFGLSSSSHIWERFGEMLSILIESHACGRGQPLRRYVDDFFKVFASLPEALRFVLDEKDGLFALARIYGIPLKISKYEGPAQTMTFLGFSIDTVTLTVALPDDKRAKYMAKIQTLVGQSTWTLRDLQSCIGVMMFISRIFKPGRALAGRLIGLQRGLRDRRPTAILTPPPAAVRDLCIFRNLLRAWPGTSAIQWVLDQDRSSDPGMLPELIFHTDATPAVGKGVVCASTGEWTFQHFSTEELEFARVDTAPAMSALEGLATLLCFATFRSSIRGKRIEVNIDNEALVLALRKGHSSSNSTQDVVSAIHLLMLIDQVSATWVFVPSAQNLADPVSRSQVSEARSMLGATGRSLHPSPKTPCLPPTLVWPNMPPTFSPTL